MRLRCHIGIHEHQGVLYMKCGCGWNHCVHCGRPKSLADDEARLYHEVAHER